MADTRLPALHLLRLKGFASDVPGADGLAADGLAVHRDGRLSGWSLTPDGRATHAKLIAEELDASGSRAAIEDGYRRFLALNQQMLGCCTQWQLRTVAGQQVPNDHTDAAHDAAAIAALGDIDDAVQPVCAELAAALVRFGTYGPRLGAARAKVEAGEVDFFTKPLIDSYHTVWFELHEDLLVTLGIERSKEVS